MTASIYNEKEISEWKRERRVKNLKDNIIPIFLFSSATVLMLYGILKTQYKEGSIEFILIVLILCVLMVLIFYREYRNFNFLRIYEDQIKLPKKRGLFLQKDKCYVKYIQKVYPNLNGPQKYIILIMAEDDPVWKGKRVIIWKEDIFSVDRFITELEKLGVKVVRDEDYTILGA